MNKYIAQIAGVQTLIDIEVVNQWLISFVQVVRKIMNLKAKNMVLAIN